MVISLNVGDQVRITGTVTLLIDPGTVKGWTRSPAGVVATYTYGVDDKVQRLSQGVYTLTFDVDAAGTWYAGIYSTGMGKAASDDVQINVKPSKRIG